MILNWFRKKERKADQLELLKAFLATPAGRDRIVNVGQKPNQSTKEMLNEAVSVRRHSETHEYQTWANTAWDMVAKQIAALATSPTQTEFHRGQLQATLELLSVAYEARLSEPKLRAQLETNSPTLRR